MKKCSMCGSQVNDDVTNCPNCGSVNFVGSDVFNQNIGAQQPMYGQNPSPIPPQPVKQQGNIGWGVLGFYISVGIKLNQGMLNTQELVVLLVSALILS